MILEKELNIYKESSSRVKLVKVLLIRTFVFFFMSYILFHFINDKGGLSKVNKLQEILFKEQLKLEEKELHLEKKRLLITQIKNPEKDLDLIDQLIRKELGYTELNEITIINH